jgi:WD40 repeat protein
MNNLEKYLSSMNSEKRFYALQALPFHLVNVKQTERLQRMLTDFSFIEAKIDALGPVPLINDFDLVLTQDLSVSKESIEGLRSIKKVIKLATHILIQDKTQLVGQLLGHLISNNVPAIKSLLEEAERRISGPWLRPLSPSLIPPNRSLMQTLTGHEDEVSAVAITPDGRYAISIEGEKLIVWDIERAVALHMIARDENDEFSDGFGEVIVTPEGRRAVFTDGSLVKVLEIERGTELLSWKDDSYPQGIAVFPDGSKIYTYSSSLITFWGLDQGIKVFTQILGKRSDTIMTIFASSSGYHAIEVSLSKDSKAWSINYDLIVWDIMNGKTLFTLRGHVEPVTCVVVSSDGKLAVSASIDCTLKVWDLNQGQLLHNLEGHSLTIASVAITPDGRRAVSASGDGTLKVWDLKRGVEIYTLAGHGGPVSSVAITPDGRRAVSGALDGSVKIWDLEVEADLSIPSQSKYHDSHHRGPVTSLVVTPDGELAISTSTDETATIWYLQKAVAILTYQYPCNGYPMDWRLSRAFHYIGFVPNHGLTSVAITPNMRYIITASADKRLKVMELSNELDFFR